MTAIAYNFHSIEADGPWTSPPFPPAERRHIVQGVIGGYIMGRPRWATDLDGNFIYGLDARGKETTSTPMYVPKPTPRRRGKSKPKTPAQLEETKPMSALDGRVLERIRRDAGATNVGLLAGDLGLKRSTVVNAVVRLIQSGRVERAEDGALTTTVGEAREHAFDVEADRRYKAAVKKTPAQLDAEIAEALARRKP